MKTSESILKWLDENEELFKVSVIAKKAGIDKGNFLRFRKEKNIPEKHLIPIMNIITPFGFSLAEVIKENNKPENKKKIEEERNPTTEKEMPNGLSKTEQFKWLRNNS